MDITKPQMLPKWKFKKSKKAIEDMETVELVTVALHCLKSLYNRVKFVDSKCTYMIRIAKSDTDVAVWEKRKEQNSKKMEYFATYMEAAVQEGHKRGIKIPLTYAELKQLKSKIDVKSKLPEEKQTNKVTV